MHLFYLNGKNYGFTGGSLRAISASGQSQLIRVGFVNYCQVWYSLNWGKVKTFIKSELEAKKLFTTKTNF